MSSLFSTGQHNTETDSGYIYYACPLIRLLLTVTLFCLIACEMEKMAHCAVNRKGLYHSHYGILVLLFYLFFPVTLLFIPVHFLNRPLALLPSFQAAIVFS